MEVEKIFTGRQETRRYTGPGASRSSSGSFGGGAHYDMDGDIDLNEHLIRNKPSTFFMRVCCNSMINASIQDGDIVIIDKSIKPLSGKIVIAVVDGEMLIRRLEKTFNRMRLIPETPKLSPIEIGEFNEVNIWGVVTYVIKCMA